MSDAALTDDVRLKRAKRQTRWLVALLEGAGAALFIGILFRDGLSNPSTPASIFFASVGTAFVTVGFVAFVLWPMTIRRGEFTAPRVTAFGALVVLMGSYLWHLTMSLVSLRPAMPGGSHLTVILYQLTDAGRVLNLLARLLEGVAAGVMFFGIFTFPIGIGIAWAVAIWGNRRI